ncbi:MAG: hypothetical protein CMO38_07685 [Verrucomicrobiaceae bacterium]|nr:hypothetical protein [Verrucomicrobiaceae bacterium]|tara:strand:- start:623 stop:1123 length:501 start_codon:yes stop_codon:yes gene_type:complete
MREWYYSSKEGNSFGPYPENEFINFFNNGQLSIETLVWTKGMGEWAPANTLQGFFSQLQLSQIQPVSSADYSINDQATIVINTGKSCLGQILQWIGLFGLLPSYLVMEVGESVLVGRIFMFVSMSLAIAGFALVNISSNCSKCETYIKSKRLKACPKCKVDFGREY